MTQQATYKHVHCRCLAYRYEHIANLGRECRRIRKRDGFKKTIQVIDAPEMKAA